MKRDQTLDTYRRLYHENLRLSKQEQLQLLDKIASGKKQAEEELLYSCTGIVEKWAHHYTRSGFPLEDRLQIGFQALLESLRDFKREYGIKFSTRAFQKVRGAIQNAIREYTFGVNAAENLVHPVPKVSHKRMHEQKDKKSEDPLEIAIEKEKSEILYQTIRKAMEKIPEIYRRIITERLGLDGGRPSEINEICKRLKICRSSFHNYYNQGLKLLKKVLEQEPSLPKTL